METSTDTRADVAQLTRWNADGHIPEESYARLISHPRFREAARAFSANYLAAVANDQALDGILKDVGRYLAATWAVGLHVSGGLTLGRLKEVCAASGYLSPGRARAVLLYMRYLRYVEVLPRSGPGSVAHYVPTRALMEAWRNQLRGTLEAAAIIEPAAELILSRLDEPGVVETFVRLQGDGFAANVDSNVQRLPVTRVFMHRHAGTQIIHWLLVAADKDDAFPPVKPIAYSVAAMARQLRVSRTHIKRVLDAAEQEGLIARTNEGALTANADLREFIRFLVTTRLIGHLICAAKILKEQPDLLEPHRAPRPEPRERKAIGAAVRKEKEEARQPGR